MIYCKREGLGAVGIQQWLKVKRVKEEKARKLILIGGEGHGRGCAEIAYLMDQWEKIYFLDDHPNLKSPYAQWLGDWQSLPNHYNTDSDFFIAVEDQELRRKLVKQIPTRYSQYATLIHPSAVVSAQTTIQPGTVIMAGVTVNHEVTIGRHVILNTNSSVDHECAIGSYTNLSPGVHLCGNVHLENGVLIDAGGIVLPNLRIYSGCLIGAGSVVTKNLTIAGVYEGTPCKRIEE